MAIYPIHRRSTSGRRLVGGVVAATVASMTVMASAWRDDSNLGAPRLWPWLLTGLQVLAFWSAGRGRWSGWRLGGSVQLPWIAYALVIDQLGFIPGCAISTPQQQPIRTSRRQPVEATT